MVVGCRNDTFDTAPDPCNTQRPIFRLLQKRLTAATISDPLETSKTYGANVHVLFSGLLATRVVSTGTDFDLFLDPGGRPLDRRAMFVDSPSLGCFWTSEVVVVRRWLTVELGGDWLGNMVGEYC